MQDTTEWADSVTVTAKFADNVGLASKQYRIGDGAWSDYTDGVTVTENTTVSFRAVDTAGNEITTNHEVKNVKMEFTGTLENETKEVVAGETAQGVIVNDKGVLTILDYGMASQITVNEGGSMTVNSGGSANTTTVKQGGSMTVSGGGYAYNITNERGTVDILKGGNAEYLSVDEGGKGTCVEGSVNGLTNYGYVSGGGTFENVKIFYGALTVSSGGKVIGLTMAEYADLTMKEKTTLQGATIEGAKATMSGTEVKGVTVASGGSVQHIYCFINCLNRRIICTLDISSSRNIRICCICRSQSIFWWITCRRSI